MVRFFENKDSKTREAFVKTVNELFNVKKKNYDGLARQMINQAIRDWVDPKSVVLDLEEVPWASDLTRNDFNLLDDDDLLEIDGEFWFTTSDWSTFNLQNSDFNQAEQPAETKGAETQAIEIGLWDIGLWTVTQKLWSNKPTKNR